MARVSLVVSVGSLFFLGLAVSVGLSDLHEWWLAALTNGGSVTARRHVVGGLVKAFLALCIWGVGCGAASLLLPHGDVNRRRSAIAGIMLGALLPLLVWMLTLFSVRAILAQQTGRLY